MELRVKETSPQPPTLNVLKSTSLGSDVSGNSPTNDDMTGEMKKQVDKSHDWTLLHFIVILIPVIWPPVLVLTWICSTYIQGIKPYEITISEAISRTQPIKSVNIGVMTIVVISLCYVTWIRIIQLRVIFDKLDRYTIKINDNKSEFVDYVCQCCCYCNRDSCGGPIIHDRSTDGNCVKNCKYYFTTLRYVMILNICF